MDYLALFMESRVALGVSVNTIGWYRLHLGYFSRWLVEEDIAVLDLTPLTFSSFVAHQRSKYSPATTAQSYGAVRTFYRWLVEMEVTTTDPTRKQKPPKVPDSFPEVVGREYIVHLLDSIRPMNWVDQRDRCMLELLFCTGLRVGEVKRLLMSDINMDARSFHVIGKGKRDRTCFIPEDFKTRLWQWMYTHRPACEFKELFLSSRPNLHVRGPMAQNTIYYMLVNRVSQAAVEWKSPHAYRHGFAVDMLRHGASTRTVQKLLGHSRLETTERYTNIVPELVQGLFDQVWDSHPLGSTSSPTER